MILDVRSHASQASAVSTRQTAASPLPCRAPPRQGSPVMFLDFVLVFLSHYIWIADLRWALFWQAETFRKLTWFHVVFRLWIHKQAPVLQHWPVQGFSTFSRWLRYLSKTWFLCFPQPLPFQAQKPCLFKAETVLWLVRGLCPFPWTNTKLHSRRNMLRIAGHCTSGKAEKRKSY